MNQPYGLTCSVCYKVHTSVTGEDSFCACKCHNTMSTKKCSYGEHSWHTKPDFPNEKICVKCKLDTMSTKGCSECEFVSSYGRPNYHSFDCSKNPDFKESHQDTKQGWLPQNLIQLEAFIDAHADSIASATIMKTYLNQIISLAVEAITALSEKHAKENYDLGREHGIRETAVRFKINPDDALSTLTK